MSKTRTSGIIWNIASYVVVGALTVCSFLLIDKFFGSSILGDYNIVLSIYLIAGHIGVWGLQTAAVYYISNQYSKKKLFFDSFFCVVLGISALVGITLAILSTKISLLFSDSSVIEGALKRLFFPIVLFSINKLLLGYLNAEKRMILYAMMKTLRYLLIVISIIVICLLGHYSLVFYVPFIVSELLVNIIILLKCQINIFSVCPSRETMKEGFKYGMRAFVSDVVNDINTKMDSVMLGILCDSAVVGHYSYITLIVESILSILFVFRENYNPYIASELIKKENGKIQLLLKEGEKKIVFLMLPLCMAAIMGYVIFVLNFLQVEYKDTILPCSILILSLLVLSKHFLKTNIFSMIGHPKIDSIIVLGIAMLNVVLNYFFILHWNIMGAALASSLSFVIYGSTTELMLKKKHVLDFP